ncbi:hypothetical protein ACIQXD_35300 [Streptomyces uncialis]|uniref:hypothetical protein n=1 Tax=Streptomyces uncialis TaxID=1048205 RepID=UPI00381C2346
MEQARQLMHEELAPLLRGFRGHGAEVVGAVAQDVADDFAQAARHALDLFETVAEMERLSNDFTGADLTRAPLKDACLQGVLWDAATLWPGDGEPHIRRASRPCDDDGDTLVIASDPQRTPITANA